MSQLLFDNVIEACFGLEAAVKMVKILRTAMRCTSLPEFKLILQPPKWSGKECNRSLTVVSCWQRNL